MYHVTYSFTYSNLHFFLFGKDFASSIVNFSVGGSTVATADGQPIVNRMC